MNTKLLAGISLAAMAGSFWACGEGPINGKEFSDTIVESMYDTPEALESLKEQAKTDCWQNDPACAAMYGSYVDPNASNPVVSSAAVIMSSSSIYQPPLGESSSSESIGNANKRSSSSGFVYASSGLEESSSSVASKPVTGLGSCAPEVATIDKGGSVTWKFKANPSSGYRTEFQGATYTWNFGDGATPATDEQIGKTQSTTVTYAVPGQITATVTVTLPGGAAEETITCDPTLFVEGSKVTGCTCKSTTADVPVDIHGGTASWAVSGCVSGNTEFTYEWDGVAGTATYSVSPTVLGEGDPLAPSVKITNSEFGTMTVTCEEVSIWDSENPNFQLTVPYNQQGTDPILKEGTYTIDMMHEVWKNNQQQKSPYTTLALQSADNTSCSVKINGKQVALNGYIAQPNTDETILLEVPANCVKSVNAYGD